MFRGVIFRTARFGMVRSPQHCLGLSPKWLARVRDSPSFAITHPTDRQCVILLSSSSRGTHPSPRRESSHSTKTNLNSPATVTPLFPWQCPHRGCSYTSNALAVILNQPCGFPANSLRRMLTFRHFRPSLSALLSERTRNAATGIVQASCHARAAMG
jgi:hypothetical protein